MTISIRTYYTTEHGTGDNGGPVRSPLQHVVIDKDRNITLGVFTRGEDGSVDEIATAAQVCKARYERESWISPFAKHRQLLLAGHGGARRLARLAMSLFNGQDYPFDASELGGLENSYLEIAIELIRSYHRLGESDREFMAVCQDIYRLWNRH